MDNTNEEVKKNLLYASFNQTHDCVIFGTDTGFYVYTLDPFKKIIARKIVGGVSIVKMLYKSNIIIFVGNVNKGLYPNKKLIIWDDHKSEVIGEISFKYQILNVKVTRDIIVVVTEFKIYVYNFQSLSLIKSIETISNIKGLCSITDGDVSFIAHPGNNSGDIFITKHNSDFLKIVNAHLSDVELFNMDDGGKYIATASKKGTLIRIYDIDKCKLRKEVRRGSDQVQIVDLKFNNDCKYVLCTSHKGTIHIFNTNLDNEEILNDNESMVTKINSGIGYGVDYFTDYLPEYFSSEWSFMQFYLNDIITYSLFINNTKEIISIGNNGCYYTLSFNNDETVIDSTYKFVSDEDDPFSDRTSTIK